MLEHISLFTGIGGIDLAAEWAGFTTVAQCEIADFPVKVLKKHWPEVFKFRDVRTITRESIRQAGIEPDGITLLSGGFPCQPHSIAGKRKASSDDRDLWGEFSRIICDLNPRWVLAENVPGLLSSEDGRFYGRVLRDLAEMGRHVGWGCWGASDVGANHKRERTFIVAYTNGNGSLQGKNEKLTTKTGIDALNGFTIKNKNVSNPAGERCLPFIEAYGQRGETSIGSGGQDVQYSNNERCEERNASTEPDKQEFDSRKLASGRDTGKLESGLGGMVDGLSAFLDRTWWRDEPDIPRVSTGTRNRIDQLKAYGNAVVPFQVYLLLKRIADYENSIRRREKVNYEF